MPTTRRTGREWTQRESPLQPGPPPPCKGTDDNRTATALGDVAWAAAGVLEPQGTSFGTVALWDPSRCHMSFCCAVMTQPLHALLKGRVHACACGQKDHLEDTKVAAFPSLCAPQKVQAGSAAVWLPPRSGDQEGERRPGYPRRSGRPSMRASVWVRATVASKKARRTGAVNFSVTQPVTGSCCWPSPSGSRVSCWAWAPPCRRVLDTRALATTVVVRMLSSAS